MKASKPTNDILEVEAFKVFIRVRPLLSKEKSSGTYKGSSKIIKFVEDGDDSTKPYVSDPGMLYNYAGWKDKE